MNHLDIAPGLRGGRGLVGPHVPAVRDQLFVAAKSDRSNPDGVRAHLERTLERLGCDRLDLYQLHGVTDLDVLDERAGAAEAILRARDEGLTRFVGITGHDLGTPRAQFEALRRYDLDTVMFPVYPRVWADPVYRTDAEALLEECAARDVGVMAIKAVARRPWGDGEVTATTWYQPYTDAERIAAGYPLHAVHARCPRVLHARRPPPAAPRPGRRRRAPAAGRRAVATRRWTRPPARSSSSRWPKRPASEADRDRRVGVRCRGPRPSPVRPSAATPCVTLLTRRSRASDQISHLLGSYCHQWMALR